MNTKINWLPFIDVSKPIWLLERSDWKSSVLIMTSMLLLLECIAYSLSVSLEEIKWDIAYF